MNYTLKELSKIINVKNTNYPGDIVITGVAIDSRKVKKGDLFIPFIGEQVDGHDYIEQALTNGASASLSMKKMDIQGNILHIEDSLAAIQKLAKHYLESINAKVVAITGSNGKTTTKDIINEVLEKIYKTHKTNGNYNNELGVPLTILDAPKDTEILILEMGADGFNQLNFLSKLTNPDFAVITNIGESHIEFFETRAGIARGKFEITEHLKENGTFIFNGDEPLLTELVASSNLTAITCGFDESNDLMIKNYDLKEQGTTFSIEKFFDNLNTNLVGRHNILNITFAIAIAKELKIKDEDIKNSIANISTLTKMRLEFLPYTENSLLINDAYNASPTSMIAAVDVVRDIKDYKKKILILGDMFELGSDEINFHRQVGEYIEKKATGLDLVISVGDLSKNITNSIQNIPTLHFNDISSCTQYLIENKMNNTVLLFKASRGMRLEKIIENLLANKEKNE